MMSDGILSRLFARSSWRAGDWVEIRPAAEIFATLDAKGSLEALPFMPEMLAYCGQRFPIFKVAHKTCDPTGSSHLRRMENTVHLQTRCNGASHDGCQAGCMFFWKTAWLKRVDGPHQKETSAPTAHAGQGPIRDSAMLERTTRVPNAADGSIRYRCQATEVVRATRPLSSLEPMQYIRDLASGNITLGNLFWYMPLAILRNLHVMLRRLMKPGASPKEHADPHIPAAGNVRGSAKLGLEPGEVIEVRAKSEIMATLDAERKNLGLTFDADMQPYCGGMHKVLRRVEKLIDEKSGKMLTIKRDCIILEGVICTGLDCRSRLFCPRSVYTFWREAWLKRTQ